MLVDREHQLKKQKVKDELTRIFTDLFCDYNVIISQIEHKPFLNDGLMQHSIDVIVRMDGRYEPITILLDLGDIL